MEEITPLPVTCKDILSQGVGYTLQFTKDGYSYLVKMPAAAADFNDKYVEKITSSLTLSEIDGAEDGIFTWLLFDFGPGTPKQVIVKQNINVTEIRTKHIDILKDVCLGKHLADPVQMDPESIIRIYFGGELKKITNNPKITYEVNFLSGSYSVGQIDPMGFSDKNAEELKNIFMTGICSQDPGCRSNREIKILQSNETMILKRPQTIDEFDRIMIDTYGNAGASIYKFGPDDKELYKRSIPLFSITYEAKLQQLDNLKKTLKQLKSPMDEPTYQSKLKEIEPPTTDAEISRFLLRSLGGKYKRYKQHHKQRKETKRKQHKKRGVKTKTMSIKK